MGNHFYSLIGAQVDFLLRSQWIGDITYVLDFGGLIECEKMLSGYMLEKIVGFLFTYKDNFLVGILLHAFLK